MLESTSSFGKFEFRPLEPGFGMTVGNALRRILLSSLEGYAITTVKVAGCGKEIIVFLIFRIGHGIICCLWLIHLSIPVIDVLLLSFGWIIFCIFSYFLLYFGIFIQNFNHYSIFVILHVRLQNYISIPIFNTFCYCTYRFTAIFPITINTATRTILTYPA